LQLSIEKSRENLRRQIARTNIHPCVLVHLASKEAASVGSFLSNDFRPRNISRIVNDQSAAFATDEIFSLMKALGGETTIGTQIFAFEFPKQTVRIVLNYRDGVLLSYLCDSIHLAADTSIMKYNNRPGPCRDMPAELPLVQVKCVRPDVYEHGPGATEDKSVGSRDKRKGGHDYFVARFEIDKECRHLERVRTGRR